MIVFAGPSLPTNARAAFSHVDWRPPACAGDLLALVDDAPEKVVLLDGLFEERAAVMHKEALALMAAGTHLYGAASMGALRAVELEAFGMIGIGTIVAAYRQGLIVGDDEVALVHGDARIGWKATSIPMVEVRATLSAAVRQGILAKPLARLLRDRWHAIHYVDREWPTMIDQAANLADPALLRAIAERHVALKTEDAIRAVSIAKADRPISRARLAFPETQFFRHLINESR